MNFRRLFNNRARAHLTERRAVLDGRPRENRIRLSPGELRSIIEYVEERLDSNLSLHRLADLVGMNVYHFLRSFRQSTGIPPHQYILRRRVERAKMLLLNGHLSIAEIALQCGFYSQSHLTTAFHRLTQFTPRDFRRTLGWELLSQGNADRRDCLLDPNSTPAVPAAPCCG